MNAIQILIEGLNKLADSYERTAEKLENLTKEEFSEEYLNSDEHKDHLKLMVE